MEPVKGFYGEFGGQFIPETLVPALDELEAAFENFRRDDNMLRELELFLKNYAGRPTPVYFARNLSRRYGVNIYLKREDLLHTGAHKINNTLGQALLARHMGKRRIIAETGAGQHGVATATVAALFGFECTVYMGSVDVERQMPNVKKMRLLGANVVPVEDGLKTLKDAVSAALKDWVATVKTTHYLLGSVTGPHPFPHIVACFQAVAGREARGYFEELGFLPDAVVACVGGGSNAMGIFQGFMDAKTVELVGVEAGGISMNQGGHSATLTAGNRGIFQGTLSYLLQNENCQVNDVHSVSAGLDYPGVGPQHAYLRDSGRVRYTSVSDRHALRAFRDLTVNEGIIPALESSHALAHVIENAASYGGKNVLVHLSGRGDKDLGIIEKQNMEDL
ncbi:MAG TPA: tryptophan synthase subunit beta [Spirochaetota bacterium]|nr:tryptophan synthase subunit beta [Spirochaetota bacterium]HRZ27027.1 tryptophan synthase subunit beta [Spirochaetota bacterium]HSA13960.1 tryptophan synthase subunit beta [Spirochaetota bacterium]